MHFFFINTTHIVCPLSLESDLLYEIKIMDESWVYIHKNYVCSMKYLIKLDFTCL